MKIVSILFRASIMLILLNGSLLRAMQSDSQASQQACDIDVPTTWAAVEANDIPISILANAVHVSGMATISVELRFQNVSARSIDSATFVIEYISAAGQVIDRVPIQGATESVPLLPSSIKIPIESIDKRWSSAIRPGERATVRGLKNGVRAGSCPSKANITFSRLQFSGGSQRVIQTTDWSLGPISRHIPMLSRPTDGYIRSFEETSVVFSIDAHGNIISAAPVDNERLSPPMSDIVSQIVRDWKFYPALHAGDPVPCSMTALVRLHTRREAVNTIKSEPLTIIDIYPMKENPTKLDIGFGLLYSGADIS